MIITINLTRDENIKYYNAEQIQIDIEDYLLGVVPSEIGNASLEASKAQAVAARTIAYARTKNGKAITDTSTKDQAFRTSRFSAAYDIAHQAVKDTKGEVLYYNGSLASSTVFSASNGGRTVSSKERWGRNYGYLIAQDDPWDKEIKSGHGVGMSQSGAKYAASIGKNYKEILAFYYHNTEIRTNYGLQQEVKKSMGLTNTEFVEFLKKMVGQPYWYGTCCYACTTALYNSKRSQYPQYFTDDRAATYKKHIANKMVASDCIGLGKGFVWSNGGASILASISTGSKIVISRGSNGCPDYGTNSMMKWIKSNKKTYGTIDTIPEIPGLCVWKDGHVGFYIGNGKVVESMGFQWGVVETKLDKRPWTHWFEFPGIIYGKKSNNTNPNKKVEEQKSTTATVSAQSNNNDKFDYKTMPTLRQGNRGANVKILQNLLLELGYDLGAGGADGIFGAKTTAAVKDYQLKCKLTVDGIVGKKTWAFLVS